MSIVILGSGTLVMSGSVLGSIGQAPLRGRFSAAHLPFPGVFPQLMCSSVQKALFEEEDHVKKLQQKVATLEKRNKQLRDRVKKVKRSLRQARKNGRHLELVNQKLSEKLAAAAGAIPHINALGQEPAGATYLRG
nr:coiled-coil domain-containing protein 3 [Manis javanica]